MTKDELTSAMEQKLQSLQLREARHQGRVRAYDRILEFASQELTDAQRDLSKVEKWSDRATEALEFGIEELPTVSVLDESSVAVRNMLKFVSRA